jgi:hypothetical protein
MNRERSRPNVLHLPMFRDGYAYCSKHGRRDERPMKLYSSYWFAPWLCVAVGALACAHDEGRSTFTETTSAALGNEQAIETLSATRCDREAECNNIGNGPFADKEQCRYSGHIGLDRVLGHDSCPNGVDKAQLDACVAVLHLMVCHNPLGPLNSFPECEIHKLCPGSTVVTPPAP